MDERAFIERRRPEWERLAEILRRASTKHGFRSLSASELADLGRLYRRVTSDLSLVNASSTSEELITYLNELAGRAHGHIFADAPTGGMRYIRNFLLLGFPILFRARWRFIAMAAGIFMIAAVFAAVVADRNPDAACALIPRQFG